ncbi:ras-domain-containing protein [Saccharata proteae CBS 121410]|uniref:Ras-domain-containing protein n=1 Tax=Saccharata proteae CBS 121410 TaxID=1314787 RepID=A0A9P4LVX4_9PEZI|nr:ras-domain-containing protein [Saccharata proteae CBS 121410]
MEDDSRISITVCGDGGCGKSSITLRLVRSKWTDDYDPTIEDSYSVTRTIDGQTYYLALTDTAGQEEYRGLLASSNLRSDAFLLVYDITTATSLSALEYFHDMIDMETEQRIDRGEVPPIKIVAGNKCDLQSARQVRSQEGLEWARGRKCGFMETSAREMVNVEETFALLVRRVVEARRAHRLGNAAANGGGVAAGQTTALPHGGMQQPGMPEKHHDGASEGPDWPKQSFWSKLKCW